MTRTPTNIKAIVIGGSAGSFQVVTSILSNLPKNFKIPIILCLHRLKHVRGGFVEALSIKTNIEIVEPQDKQNVKPGKAYLAPANYHLSVELGYTFALSTEEMVSFSRPAIDVTMESCGFVYKHKMVGIILSGANKDGAYGLKKVSDYGGLTIVQDPNESRVQTMPKASMELTDVNYVYSTNQIIQFLNSLNA